MNRTEYKKLSHGIREKAWKRAGNKHTTRVEIHNLLCWIDDLQTDCFGHWRYKYSCIGDVDTGLVWEKS